MKRTCKFSPPVPTTDSVDPTLALSINTNGNAWVCWVCCVCVWLWYLCWALNRKVSFIIAGYISAHWHIERSPKYNASITISYSYRAAATEHRAVLQLGRHTNFWWILFFRNLIRLPRCPGQLNSFWSLRVDGTCAVHAECFVFAVRFSVSAIQFFSEFVFFFCFVLALCALLRACARCIVYRASFLISFFLLSVPGFSCYCLAGRNTQYTHTHTTAQRALTELSELSDDVTIAWPQK